MEIGRRLKAARALSEPEQHQWLHALLDGLRFRVEQGRIVGVRFA